MKAPHLSLLALTALAASLGIGNTLMHSASLAQDLPIPQEIYGKYAPAGNCAQEPRVDVGAKGIFIDYQKQHRGPLAVDVCYSCAGGARYDGIQRWVYVKEGKDRYGDNKPMVLMFNANEQKGRLETSQPGSLVVPLSAATNAVVKASPLQLCDASSAHRPAMTQAANIPAKEFAQTVVQLMRPLSLSSDSFYDWNYLESVRNITWAPLPPVMLDKPLLGGHYFKRVGTLKLANQSLDVIAGGARSMVMVNSFRNQGQPIGETSLLNALKESGVSISTARCSKMANLPAPRWYRLSASGKQSAFFWIAPARGQQQPWEVFRLSLENTLPPMSPQEKMVYTDSCGN